MQEGTGGGKYLTVTSMRDLRDGEKLDLILPLFGWKRTSGEDFKCISVSD